MSLVAGVLYFIVNMLYIEKYSKHQRKGKGLDLANIKGDRHAREQREINGTSSQPIKDSQLDPYCDGGAYIGPCDVNKFTDVPLDEETPESKTKFTKHLTNRNKRNSSSGNDNSSV